MKARTFADLMAGHESAEIYCLYNKDLVRHLKVVGERVEVMPMEGDPVSVLLDTPIVYEPWFMDRGSLLFSCRESKQAKICTEADLIRFPDGVEEPIEPFLG